jgi:hypothetical protein
MPKKPPSAVRGIKKGVVFPSRKKEKKISPRHGFYAAPQGANCGADRAHGHVRGPGLACGRPGQRPRTWAQGGAATEQVYGTYAYAKTASKSAIKLLQMALATPHYSPKSQNAAFWHSESPQTHNTRTATHCRHHIAQCYPLGVRWRRVGSRLLLGETRMGPQHRQNGGQRAAGTTLGTWDAAGGHFHGTWPPRVARSYPPFVTQQNLPNQTTRKSQYVPKRKAYLLPTGMGMMA